MTPSHVLILATSTPHDLNWIQYNIPFRSLPFVSIRNLPFSLSSIHLLQFHFIIYIFFILPYFMLEYVRGKKRSGVFVCVVSYCLQLVKWWFREINFLWISDKILLYHFSTFVVCRFILPHQIIFYLVVSLYQIFLISSCYIEFCSLKNTEIKLLICHFISVYFHIWAWLWNFYHVFMYVCMSYSYFRSDHIKSDCFMLWSIAKSYYVIWEHIMLCYVMLCYVMLCYIMVLYVMWYCIVLCDVMFCYVISNHITSTNCDTLRYNIFKK